MDNIKISVIIPVYNVAPYLEKSIDSVLQQSYSNLQIILVDDGSNDGSEFICDRYAMKDSRITVIHQSNKGLSVARNTGMNIADGDWIAFLDSDDWLEKDAYKTLLGIATKYNAEIASCLSRDCVYGKTPSPRVDSDRIFIFDDIKTIVKELRQKQRLRVEVWNKIWRKSLVDDIRFVPGQVSEDIHFDRITFLRANRIVHIDRTLHNYLICRPGSTNSSFKMARFHVFEEYDAFIQELEAKKESESATIIKSMAVRYLLNMYIEAVDKNQTREVKKKIVYLFKRYYKEMQPTKYLDKAAIVFYHSPCIYYSISKMKVKMKNNKKCCLKGEQSLL